MRAPRERQNELTKPTSAKTVMLGVWEMGERSASVNWAMRSPAHPVKVGVPLCRGEKVSTMRCEFGKDRAYRYSRL
jgi:hypothetical protein